MNETDHVKEQLCARIEELESEKMELNEQVDSLQEERNALQNRPDSCRNELQAQGKPYPKSGCAVCGNGGMAGCPYEARQPSTHLARLKDQRQVEALEEVAFEWRRDEMNQDDTDCVEHLERKARHKRQQAEGGEAMSAATQNEMERLVRVNREQQTLLEQIYQYVDEQGLAKLGQSRVKALIEAHKRAEAERDEAARDLAMEQEHHQATRRSEEALAAHLERLQRAFKDMWQAVAVTEYAFHHLVGHEQEVAEIYASRLRQQDEGGEA